MSDQLTIEQFKQVLPTQVKKTITQELVDSINKIIIDPEFRETYRDNLLSYTSVMANGKFKINNYVDAVRYVSFKLQGDTNIMAYTKTFPDKYQRFVKQGVASKDIASYITAYNKSKLVGLIFEQTLTPVYVLNQDKAQEAINVLAELMRGAQSEKVRSDSADKLLVHLKMPEVNKIELDIGIKEDGSIAALRETTLELVRQQKNMIQAGAMNAKEVAESSLIVDGVVVNG